jgi:hypothetical protein
MTDNDITALIDKAMATDHLWIARNPIETSLLVNELACALANALEPRPMTADREAAIEIMAQALTGKQGPQLIDDRRDELLYVMRREAAIAFDALVASGALRPVADAQAEAWDKGFAAAVNYDMGDREQPPEEYVNPYRTPASPHEEDN